MSKPEISYTELLKFAETTTQQNTINAIVEHGSQTKAAESLGVEVRSVERIVARVKKYAKAKDFDPDKLPPGSKRYNIDPETGKKVYLGGWDQSDKYKSKEDVSELISAAIDGLRDDIPVYDKIKLRKGKKESDLLNLYILTDVHLGMLAWAPEGGADWDMDIAEATIIKSFEYLIEHSPNAEVGFFCNLGDMLHYDGMLAMTNASGHILDSDTRPYKLVKAASRIVRKIVSMMLKKYKKVIALSCQGNHDEKSSMWIMEILDVAYGKNKRVEIIESPKPHYVYKHGKIMLGFHHGHKLKGKLRDLEHKFNTEFREHLGDTIMTLVHTGHYHEWKVDGNVEQHPTIAARDYYTSSNLYNSIRAMRCITYHKNTGEKSRITFNP